MDSTARHRSRPYILQFESLQNKFCTDRKRQSADFKALQLPNGWSGCGYYLVVACGFYSIYYPPLSFSSYSISTTSMLSSSDSQFLSSKETTLERTDFTL